MLEFICGIGVGVGMCGAAAIQRQPENRSVGVQIDEVWSQTLPSHPILIQNSKTNFIPKLKNFWGPDS